MRKVMALFTLLALMLSLCACSKKVEEPTWQEQFDMGDRKSTRLNSSHMA